MRNYNSIIFFIMAGLAGCGYIPSLDKVLPDEREEYRKSKDLPPLEVPPDLTHNTNADMAIPGEEEAVTLSEFQRQRAQAAGAVVLGKGEFAGEQWIALQAPQESVWPKLLHFWEQQGFTVELIDQELGVMETGWRSWEENSGTLRERFGISSETGKEGETVLYLSGEQQLAADGEWLDAQMDIGREREIIRALNLFFYGSAQKKAATDSVDSGAHGLKRQRAELLYLDGNHHYLSLPAKFTSVFHNMQRVLKRAGIRIENKNQEYGTYDIMYFKPEDKKKKGLLDKLKFWTNAEENGIPLQLSLTGVGDKTELIVFDNKGNWAADETAKAVLDVILRHYNQP